MPDLLRDRLQTSLGAAYTLERELGGGGMARVFVARDEALGRDVVVKVLAPELAAGLSAERFAREIRLAAQLQEPHIVPVHAAGTTADGLPYYTMPFVRGESLRARMAQGPVPLGEAVSILRDVARALAYAHRQGVVHRDIKPENVLLHEGTAVVTDFGIAKALAASKTEAPGGTLTQAGTSLGTPAYMAPEQAVGDDVDHRADLYACGVVAYELLAGSHPFAGRTTARQLIAAHIGEAPAPLGGRCAAVPAPLATLVMRCLEKDPARRPRSATELLDALERVTAVGSGPTAVVGGVMGESAASPHGSTPRARRLALGATLAVAAVVSAAVIGVAGRGRPDGRPPATSAPAAGAASRQSSVAVLPFENIGSDRENEIFSDGVTEDVIAALARIEGLTVISRTSAMAYKGTAKPLRQVAAELGVGAILEGSVRRAGSRVRVVAQLIDARTDTHLWVETYDRELADVFAIQAEVAERIARSLSAALSPETRERLATAPTRDTVAYQLYLKGRAAWNERNEAALRRAIGYFEGAIRRDSAFALAHAGLGDSYLVLPFYGSTPTAEVVPRAHAAVDRALALDPDLGEALAARAYLLGLYQWRWPESEREFRRAIALNPGSATVRQWYGNLLGPQGRHDEAIAEGRRAVELDPLSTAVVANLAYSLTWARRDDEALRWYRKALELEPRNSLALLNLAAASWATGRWDVAIDATVRYQEVTGTRFVSADRLRRAVAAGGRPAALRLLLASAPETFAPLLRASWHAQLGERDVAIRLLERQVAERAVVLPWLTVYPGLDALRGDPRFQALVRSMGLTP